MMYRRYHDIPSMMASQMIPSMNDGKPHFTDKERETAIKQSDQGYNLNVQQSGNFK